MKILKRIYKFIFERDCVDYTQPYVCDNIDSGFDKYEKYVVPVVDKKYTMQTSAKYYPTGISDGVTNLGRPFYLNKYGLVTPNDYNDTMGIHNRTIANTNF